MTRKEKTIYQRYFERFPEHGKSIEFDTIEECIEYYRKWKQAMADFFQKDEELKTKRPAIYRNLTSREVTDNEIKKLKEYFAYDRQWQYSKTLTSEDYELN